MLPRHASELLEAAVNHPHQYQLLTLMCYDEQVFIMNGGACLLTAQLLALKEVGQLWVTEKTYRINIP